MPLAGAAGRLWPVHDGVQPFAASGIADDRGIAAALMLGANGVLLGTRFWAAQEALIHPAAASRVLRPNT